MQTRTCQIHRIDFMVGRYPTQEPATLQVCQETKEALLILSINEEMWFDNVNAAKQWMNHNEKYAGWTLSECKTTRPITSAKWNPTFEDAMKGVPDNIDQFDVETYSVGCGWDSGNRGQWTNGEWVERLSTREEIMNQFAKKDRPPTFGAFSVAWKASDGTLTIFGAWVAPNQLNTLDGFLAVPTKT